MVELKGKAVLVQTTKLGVLGAKRQACDWPKYPSFSYLKQTADLSLRFRDTLLWTSLGLAASAGIKPGCSSLPTFSCTGYPDNNAAAD